MNIIQQIDAEIAALRDKKAAIQTKCSHPSVTATKNGDEGNILTGREASAWLENQCDLCGQQWRSEQ